MRGESRATYFTPDKSSELRQENSHSTVSPQFILRQAMLLDRPHCPSRHPSSWKRWEPLRSSAVTARREYPWQLQEPSQWRACSGSNSEIQAAHFWRLAMTGFERMPQPTVPTNSVAAINKRLRFHNSSPPVPETNIREFIRFLPLATTSLIPSTAPVTPTLGHR